MTAKSKALMEEKHEKKMKKGHKEHEGKHKEDCYEKQG